MRRAAASLLIFAAAAASAQETDMDWIRPRALHPGDTIALVAPANSVDSRDFAPIVERFESWGYHVRLPSNTTLRYGNMAGDDATRAREFMAAWLDPEVDMVWCITGGYGTMRMIPMLDFDAIRAHPKIMAGMSDITGLHQAIGRRSRLVTFLGPNAIWPIIRDDMGPCEYAQRWVWRALRADSYFDPTGTLLPEGYSYEFPTEPHDPQQSELIRAPVKTIVGGRAEGRLVGGNTSLIASMVGSPYQIETEGRILVLEDVGEEPYRLDRMMQQLELAGLLEHCAGVILGTWSGCQPEAPERSLSIDQVLHDHFAHRPYPVIANFPTGHVPEQAMLPLGCRAELNGSARTLRLLENPVIVE